MAYLIVSLFDEEEEEIREVVVPDFWFCDGFCRMPLKGLDAKSESKEMFKASWPSFEVKVLSKHSKLPSFDALCLMISSAISFHI